MQQVLPFVTSSDAFVTSSFLFLVVWPGATIKLLASSQRMHRAFLCASCNSRRSACVANLIRLGVSISVLLESNRQNRKNPHAEAPGPGSVGRSHTACPKSCLGQLFLCGGLALRLGRTTCLVVGLTLLLPRDGPWDEELCAELRPCGAKRHGHIQNDLI